MSDRVYNILELVGSSEESVEHAINNAIAQAGAKHEHLDWFEVVSTRGLINDNKVKYFQVHIKIGCFEEI